MKTLCTFCLLLSCAIASAQISPAAGGTGRYGLTPYSLLTGGIDVFQPVISLPLGTAGQILTSAGTGATPTWKYLPGAVVTKDTATTGQTLIGTPLAIALNSPGTYQFELGIYDSSSSAAGIKFGFALPTDATVVSLGGGATTGATAWSTDIITAGATAGVATATVAGYSLYQANGIITVVDTTGSVIPEFLKATSGTAIVKAGSYFIVQRIK